MNHIKRLMEANTEKGIALAKVQRDINAFLCFLESSKFVGTENGERKDWIATGDVKHFLMELRQETII